MGCGTARAEMSVIRLLGPVNPKINVDLCRKGLLAPAFKGEVIDGMWVGWWAEEKGTCVTI